MARLPKITEPKYDGKMTNLQLVEALNWYHQNQEPKDAQRFLLEYAKKNKIPGRVDTSKSYLTLAWLCRLVSNGNDVGSEAIRKIKSGLPALLEKEKAEVVVDAIPAPSIQERMREKIGEIAGELEGCIDDYILSGFKDARSPLALMQDKAKGMHATKIIEIFKKRRTEFDEVLHTTNKDLKEAYSYLNKTQLKKLVAYCDLIITDAMKIAGEAKASRKPRKRKQKTPDQLVATLQFCQTSDEFKVSSIKPREIIGAMQLWVFNLKTKKIGVYHAEDASGFSVKGSSLLNYSEMKSLTKTARKPEEVLTSVTKGGKIILKNLLSTLKTKESALNGRINKDTLLLRVL
jgi:hypothetical protein